MERQHRGPSRGVVSSSRSGWVTALDRDGVQMAANSCRHRSCAARGASSQYGAISAAMLGSATSTCSFDGPVADHPMIASLHKIHPEANDDT